MFYLKDVAIFGGILLFLFFALALKGLYVRAAGDNAVKFLAHIGFLFGALSLYFALFQTFDFTVKIVLFFAFCGFLFYCERKYPREGNLLFLFRAFAKIRNLRGVNLALALYLAFVFALTFLLTLAPPNGADYDSLVYHLAVPTQYLRHNGIVQLPYDHHSYFPFTMEMLYQIGLALSGPVLAKLFHWLMLPLCCLTLFAMGRRHASTRAGLFAAAIFASFPLVLWLASTAYIELGFTLFVLLAFACFLNWQNAIGGARRGVWLLWSGAFCGFALGTKYLGALTLFWLGISALIFLLREQREYSQNAPRVLAVAQRDEKISAKTAVRADWKNLAGFAIIAILLGGFWYVRNFIWTGNPVFPFAYGVFGGRGWTAQMAADYDKSQAIYGFGKSPLDLIFAAVSPRDGAAQRRVFKDVGVLGVPSWPLGFEAVGGGKPARSMSRRCCRKVSSGHFCWRSARPRFS